MIHSYYTYTKEQLLESPKLRLECYETKEEVFQQMAQEMAEEIVDVYRALEEAKGGSR